MAGFDKVDPANPCLECGAPQAQVRAEAHVLTAQVTNPTEQCECLSLARKPERPERAFRVGEPEQEARCVC